MSKTDYIKKDRSAVYVHRKNEWEDIELIKEKIIQKIYRDDHVSFPEIEQMFEEYKFDYKGNKVIHHEKYPNLVIWTGWNEKSIKMLNEIVSNNEICLQTTQYLTYLIDGVGLDIPIATDIKDYKRNHWLPMVLRPELKCKKNKSKIN